MGSIYNSLSPSPHPLPLSFPPPPPLPPSISRGLMYGYAVSGAEAVNSSFANSTGYPVPKGFSVTIIPSLLFGSLISATDPGLEHKLYMIF